VDNSQSLTAQSVADLVGGTLHVSTDTVFDGLESLIKAQSSDITFLGNEKYYKDFLVTKSHLVLTTDVVTEAPEGVGIIHVENPTLAFSKVVEHFSQQCEEFKPGVSAQAFIAESAQLNKEKVRIMPGAIVGEGVCIADGVTLHSGAVLGDGVTVGEHTIIYSNVVVRECCHIGANVILQPGCIIGSDGFGYEMIDGKHVKIPQVGNVIVEDYVEIGANSTIDRARFGRTIIGEGTKIDNLTQVAHNVVLGKHNLLVAQSGIAGSTTTEDYVIVGAQAGVAGHLHLGQGVVVAGQSGLAKSVSEPGYYQGTPARPIKESRKAKALVNRLPQINARLKKVEETLQSQA